MELLKHELYKIFSKKSIWIVLIIYMAFTSCGLFFFDNWSMDEKQRYERYEQIKGPLTQEKVKIALKESKEILKKYNKNLPENFYEDYNRIQMPPEKSADYNNSLKYLSILDTNYEITYFNSFVKNKLEKQLEKYKNNKNSFEYKEVTLHLNTIKKLNPPELYYDGPWHPINGHLANMSFKIITVLLILGLSSIFSDEYNVHMDYLILSSKQGRKKLITAKLLGGMLFSIFIYFIVTFYEIIVNFLYYGKDLILSGANKPMLIDYVNHVNYTNLEIRIYAGLIQLITFLALALFIILISVISKSSMLSLFTNGVVFIVSLIALNIDFILIKFIKYFGYGNILSNAQNIISQFKVFNFFGNPLTYVNAIMIVLAISSVITVFLSYFVFKRKQVS